MQPDSEDLDLPVFRIFAGPNGAGKSTLINGLLSNRLNIGPVINPDEIARDLAAADFTKNIEIAAGRRALSLTRQYISERVSFCRETTLSGKEVIGSIKHAKSAGFVTILYFVGVADLELAMSRVSNRVARGGHNIPEHVQVRRFPKVMKNLMRATKLTTLTYFFDNSMATGHRYVGAAFDGQLCRLSNPSPIWLSEVARTLDRMPGASLLPADTQH